MTKSSFVKKRIVFAIAFFNYLGWPFLAVNNTGLHFPTLSAVGQPSSCSLYFSAPNKVETLGETAGYSILVSICGC